MSDERDERPAVPGVPDGPDGPDGPAGGEGLTREPAPADVETDPVEAASSPEQAGGSVEWRPEMAEDTEGGTDPDVYGDDVYDESEHEPVEPEPEDGWDPDPGPVAGGNGAAGRYAGGRGTSPPARRRPASARPPAGRPTATGSDEGEESSEGEEGGLAAKQKRQVIVLSVLTVLVVGIGAAGFLLSRGASETGQDAIGGGGPTTSVRAGPTIPAADMLQIHDPVTNFNVKVPKAWQNLQPPVADIRLVMAAGEGDALSVRVLPIQTPATVENIGNFKEVTDAIVFGDRTAKLLQEQLIRVNNNLAYHYIYTFTDRTSGQEGVHAHYFIFEGNRMFSVVFQTIPTQDFVRLAPLFDQVAESISIGAAPTTTTTAAP